MTSPAVPSAAVHVGIERYRSAATWAADLLALVLSAMGTYWLAAGATLLAGAEYSEASKVFSERLVPFSAAVGGLSLWLFSRGHYRFRVPFWEETAYVATACFVALMGEGLLTFALKADGSRLSAFLTWMAAPFAIMGMRAAVKCTLAALGAGKDRAIVIGRMDLADRAARVVSADAYMGYEIAGIHAGKDLEGAVRAARSCSATTAVIALSGADSDEESAAARLRREGLSIILVPSSVSLPSSSLRAHYVMGHDALMLIDRSRTASFGGRIAKRSFDVAVSGLVLALVALPMAAVALAVRRDGGPAFYSHSRIGEGGREFGCLKFRSMAVDAAERLESLLANDADARQEWEQTRKLKNDPRVTKLGKFIRKTALDELPQLINVLRGDMSLVGPRPVTESEMERYGEAVPLYKSVRPGVTGLWQVSGRNDLSYEERVALDAWYVRNWSPWHDTAILLKTVPALLFRRGAY